MKLSRDILGESLRIVDVDGSVYDRSTFVRLVDHWKLHLQTRLPPKSRVAIYADNTILTYALAFALWELGHCFYGDEFKDRVLHRAIEVLRVEAIFVDQFNQAEVQSVVPHDIEVISIPADPQTWASQVPDATPMNSPNAIHETDDVLIGFTSGSTSAHPRIAFHSHRSLLAASDHMAKNFYQHKQPMLIYLNLNHLGYLSCIVIAAFRAGCEMHILPRADLARIADKIREGVVRIVPLFGYNWFHLLNEYPDISLKNVDLVVTGGDLVSAEFVQTIFARGAGAIANVYGMTEILPPVSVKSIRPADLPHYTDQNLGAPAPHVEVRIVDGEIQLRGDNQGRIEPPDSISPDGFVRTGDAGFLRDGELFMRHRKKHLINLGGREVAFTDVAYLVRTLKFKGRPLKDFLQTEGLDVRAHGDQLFLILVPREPEALQFLSRRWLNDQIAKVFGDEIQIDKVIMRSDLPFNGLKLDHTELTAWLEREYGPPIKRQVKVGWWRTWFIGPSAAPVETTKSDQDLC